MSSVLAADAAPWWGVAVISATSAVIGGLISAISTRAVESRRLKAEQAHREAQILREAAIEFLSNMNSLAATLFASEEAPSDATTKLLADAGNSLTNVTLAGYSPTLRKAGQAYFTQIDSMVSATLAGTPSPSPDDFERALELRRAFIDEAQTTIELRERGAGRALKRR